MDLRTLNELKKIYSQGKNISQFLREKLQSKRNTPEIIQVSYDFQAGSYIAYAEKNPKYFKQWSEAIAKEINSLPLKTPFSILEAGVGEATTFSPVVSLLGNHISNAYGFDISWSRLRYGLEHLKSYKIQKKTTLFLADLFSIPLADNSIDVVYTAHSIEPNGGKEKEILQELYRITSQYLVLLEPSYTFGSAEARKRMKQHGFITKLPEAAKELGYEVVSHRLFDICSNPLNPTGLLIIKKRQKKSTISFRCPVSGEKLEQQHDCYNSSKGLLSYPIIGGIPCLLPQNAIVTTHYNHFASQGR